MRPDGSSSWAQSAGRGRWRHMAQQDAEVWQQAVELGLVRADQWRYDVELGGAEAKLAPADHPLAGMWERLLRKRVDVVGVFEGRTTLYEVKPVAGFTALGQALGYELLYAEQFPWESLTRPAVVCARVDADLRRVFYRYGVTLVVLPDVVGGPLLAAQDERSRVRARGSTDDSIPASPAGPAVVQ